MTVFADAFFYVAFMNRLDEHHDEVMEWAQSFSGKIVTTQWILTEVADAFAESHLRRRIKAGFESIVEDSATRVIEVSPEYFARGMKLYDERPDKEWSLTDCISMVVMADEGLTEVLTKDHHFEQAGFSVVFAD